MLSKLLLHIAAFLFLGIGLPALADKAGYMVNIVHHLQIVGDQIQRRGDVKDTIGLKYRFHLQNSNHTESNKQSHYTADRETAPQENHRLGGGFLLRTAVV